MLKNDKIKSFIMGFISYFVLTIILELFGVDTFIVRSIIGAIIILIGYFIKVQILTC
jgi:hypothetical protein